MFLVVSSHKKSLQVWDAAHVCSEWASGDNSATIHWDYGTDAGVAYHTFARQQQNEFKEDSELAAWGDWYWSTADGNGVSRRRPLFPLGRKPPVSPRVTVDARERRRHRRARRLCPERQTHECEGQQLPCRAGPVVSDRESWLHGDGATPCHQCQPGES